MLRTPASSWSYSKWAGAIIGRERRGSPSQWRCVGSALSVRGLGRHRYRCRRQQLRQPHPRQAAPPVVVPTAAGGPPISSSQGVCLRSGAYSTTRGSGPSESSQSATIRQVEARSRADSTRKKSVPSKNSWSATRRQIGRPTRSGAETGTYSSSAQSSSVQSSSIQSSSAQSNNSQSSSTHSDNTQIGMHSQQQRAGRSRLEPARQIFGSKKTSVVRYAQWSHR